MPICDNNECDEPEEPIYETIVGMSFHKSCFNEYWDIP